MCGIFGYIGDIPKGDQRLAFRFLENLFIKSKSRGEDASGFASVNMTDSPLFTEKRNICAEKFVRRSKKFSSLKKGMPHIFIGHTRKYTSGSPNRNRNNHPFKSHKYALVHNGIVKDWQKTAASLNLELRTETDSEIIIRILDRKAKVKFGSSDSVVDISHSGLQQVVSSTEFGTRMALAFINHGDDPELRRLFLFKNFASPLHIVRVNRWKTVFFASTDRIIKDAIDETFDPELRAEVKRHFEIGNIKEIESYNLLTFGINKHGDVVSSERKLEQKTYYLGSGTSARRGGSTYYNSDSATSSYECVSPCEKFREQMEKREAKIASKHERTEKERAISTSVLPSLPDTEEDERIVIVTKEEIEKLPESSKEEIEKMSKELNRVMGICRSLHSNKYMTDEEYDHFQEWLYRV